MAASILWAPGIVWFFLLENKNLLRQKIALKVIVVSEVKAIFEVRCFGKPPMPINILILGGGGSWKGGRGWECQFCSAAREAGSSFYQEAGKLEPDTKVKLKLVQVKQVKVQAERGSCAS